MGSYCLPIAVAVLLFYFPRQSVHDARASTANVDGAKFVGPPRSSVWTAAGVSVFLAAVAAIGSILGAAVAGVAASMVWIFRKR